MGQALPKHPLPTVAAPPQDAARSLAAGGTVGAMHAEIEQRLAAAAPGTSTFAPSRIDNLLHGASRLVGWAAVALGAAGAALLLF